jgi:hypothetical protein
MSRGELRIRTRSFVPLDTQHSTVRDWKQVMPKASWFDLVVGGRDTVAFGGHVYQLSARRLPLGRVAVSKGRRY